MAQGKDDPSDGDEGRVLSPDELDFTDDEHVAEIDDGRYVVSPDDPIGDVPGTTQSRSQPDTPAHGPAETGDGSPDPPVGGQADRRESETPADPPRREVSEGDVREWLGDQFEATDSRYGFDVTGKFDGAVEQRKMVSNDVVTIFESLVLWYAQQIDSNTPVEEVLGILLVEANVPVRYPAASLRTVLESTDLTPEDSIADLVDAVDEDGFRI